MVIGLLGLWGACWHGHLASGSLSGSGLGLSEPFARSRDDKWGPIGWQSRGRRWLARRPELIDRKPAGPTNIRETLSFHTVDADHFEQLWTYRMLQRQQTDDQNSTPISCLPLTDSGRVQHH